MHILVPVESLFDLTMHASVCFFGASGGSAAATGGRAGGRGAAMIDPRGQSGRRAATAQRLTGPRRDTDEIRRRVRARARAVVVGGWRRGLTRPSSRPGPACLTRRYRVPRRRESRTHAAARTRPTFP